MQRQNNQLQPAF